MEIQWTLVIFTLLTCMGTGMFALVTIADLTGRLAGLRQTGALLALGLIIAGGLASVLHLSHPFRAIYVLGNLNTSVGREMVLIGIEVVLIAGYFWTVKRNNAKKTPRSLSFAGLICSVILAFEIGATYVLPGQPAWNSYLLPLVYLSSAGVLGIFGIYVLFARKGSEEDLEQISQINRLAISALVIQAVLVFAYTLNLSTAVSFDSSILATGTGILLFGLGVVAVGLAVPFVLTIRFLWSKKNASNAAAISLLCTIIGGIAFRAMMFTLGSGFELII